MVSDQRAEVFRCVPWGVQDVERHIAGWRQQLLSKVLIVADHSAEFDLLALVEAAEGGVCFSRSEQRGGRSCAYGQRAAGRAVIGMNVGVDREPNRCPGDGRGIQVGCNRLDGIDDLSGRICMQELPQDHENSSTPGT